MDEHQLSPVQERETRRLLELSCKLYDAMEQIYRAFEDLQLTNSDQVTPLLAELESLKSKVHDIDTRIMLQFQNSTPPAALVPAVQMRKEKIRSLIQLNKGLVESVQRYKALIQNELSNLYRNRNAMSGYKTAQEKTSLISGAY